MCEKKKIPRWEIVNIADKHLQLSNASFRIGGGEPGVHLQSHGISHLLQLPSGGPKLLLKFLHYGHGLRPLLRALHTASHHHDSCGREHCRRAYHRCTHHHLPHSSLSVCVCMSCVKRLKEREILDYILL